MNLKKYKKIVKQQLDHVFRDISALASPATLFFILVFLLVTELRLGVVFAIGIFLIEVFCYSIKVLFPTTRPDKQKYANLLEKMDAGSFPSIDSARIIFTGGMLLTIWNHVVLIILVVFLVLIVAASRIYLKRHYLKDVIGGYILGLIIWLILLKLTL